MMDIIQYVGSPLGLLAVAMLAAVVLDTIAVGKDSEVKTIPDDPLVAEAYSWADRCPNAYQRGELRGVVDGFVKRMLDCQQENMPHAEHEERRRLATWVQCRRLGS